MMSEWIKLDSQQFSARATQRRRENGIQIAVSLSPYDIPDAVRGRFDDKSARFVVEFSYIEDEDWILRPHRDHLYLRVGKNSGRLYGIEVDVRALQADSVELKMRLPKLVSKAIDEELSESKGFARRHENYEIAKSVLSTARTTLFGALAGV